MSVSEAYRKQRHQAQPGGCPRVVATLTGHVHYKDSGWTPFEWQLIEDVMSRCASPGLHLTGKPAPRQPAPLALRPLREVAEELRTLATELDRRVSDPMS